MKPVALPPDWSQMGLPCDAQGPVFAEPWQGQVFALTVALHQRGVFAWSEWAQYLGSAIKDAQRAGDPDLGDTYYEHWCSALENLLRDRQIAAPMALASLRQAWRLAAEKTPHGKPIVLRRTGLMGAGPDSRSGSAPRFNPGTDSGH